MTICKLVLITCIVGFAAAVVSIGHKEEASIVATEIAAPHTTQMCPVAQGQMSRPIGATYKRYLRHAPVSYTARRDR
jgi:hypothetical protein